MVKVVDFKNWLKVLEKADETSKRQFAAAMALDLEWGGITAVEKLTGMSHTTIRKGIQEIQNEEKIKPAQRIRRPGGGRKKIDEKDPRIIEDIEAIMDENTAGDPMSLLKWTHKSTYNITEELKKLGHDASPNTVGRLLKEKGYSLQANLKTKEWGSMPERDAQFRYINKQAKKFMKKRWPVISVDTKKREFVGDFKNAGTAWRKKGNPKEVSVYDFRSLAIGVAIPYGTYDMNRNEGFVNVGISRDTSEFAVESVRQWWHLMGEMNYPDAGGLLITADSGGSNGRRRKGWKYHLQDLSNQTGIPITVCHLPPGTSKWNKIEHRMFSFISMNWKGEPLANYETVINHINETKTKTGLIVVAKLDEKEYEGGRKFSDAEMAQIRLEKHAHLPSQNYTISPYGE